MESNYRLRNTAGSLLSLGLLAACIGIFLTIGATVAIGQSTSTGSVTGVVTDSQKGVVSGAEVVLIDAATKTPLKTKTNEAGRYTFVDVQPGIYDISVTRTGFQRAVVSGQKIAVGVVLTVDVPMQVGSVSETVTITAAAGTELQTTTAAVGTVLSGKDLDIITNLGRDANSLFVLQPAVAPTGEVAGAVRDQNTYQLDGGNNSDDMAGTNNTYTQAVGFIGSTATGGTPSGVMPTPAESVEEFKVATNNQAADFNGSAGGQISLVTKRGTNQYHGAAYEHFFGSNFGANFWQNNHTPIIDAKTKQVISPFTPLPATHQNRYGFSFGGPVAPSFLGGKTYLFANYEARRFPQSVPTERFVPSELMRAGVIQVPDSTGAFRAYNLNPNPVTVNGVTYQPATCGASNVPCDPRHLGLNPLVSQLWSKYMPLPNDPSFGDQRNTQGYLSSVLLPVKTDFFVARIDHDFNEKWHLMGSYRYYRLDQLANTQIDIGGLLGGTLGQPKSTAPRQQKPSYYVVGLVTNVTSNMTNDFHYNYLRNFWEWSTAQAPPQLAGLGGALEIGGEGTSGGVPVALIPYNVNTQNVRQRYWDGHDHTFRDDVNWIHGNHLFQFGGSYERNWDQHQRNDNGQGVMAANVYQITNNPGLTFTAGGVNYIPSAVPSAQVGNWQTLYTEVLGIVGQPQSLFTRKLPDLSLQPLGTPAFDRSIIPSYNVYFSDTWHVKPSLTVSYGMGYMIEMPPFETDGKQVMLVDSSGKPVITEDYLAQRKSAALAGQVFNPTLGFATIKNVAGGRKYPYDPFYGGLSPRVSVAWNPRFEHGILGRVLGEGHSVIRGGYNRIYGRLNGVDLVLVPLLGTGLLQPVQCQGAVNAAAAVGGSQCLGVNGANPITAFRIGPDGLVAPLPTASQTLPQPFFPGTLSSSGVRLASAGGGSSLDPHFKPNQSDQVDFTFQRELISRKIMMEVGYIGRRIRNEYQSINLDAVPYMTTLGGQTFADAFKNIFLATCGLGIPCSVTPVSAITPQPFFEAALGGANSAFCSGFASCTAAVVSKQSSAVKNALVYNLWNALANTSSWTLGRTLPSSIPPGGCTAASALCQQLTSIFMETSTGYGNYNAAFFALGFRDWHGVTAQSNFTWSRAMGTGAVTQSTSSFSVIDPWDLSAMYGPQSYDVRFLYNLAVLWEPTFFHGRKGITGRLLDGWTFSPLFQARSGFPLQVSINTGVNANCQSFGEMNCNEGSTNENAVLALPYTGGSSAHKGATVTGGVGQNTNPANGGVGINMFSDPGAVYSEFRRLLLGLDHNAGGAGRIYGLPTWSLDLSVAKKFRFNERIGMDFLAQFANVLNHFQPNNPTLNIDSPQTWGNITGPLPNTFPRQIEFGLRVHF